MKICRQISSLMVVMLASNAYSLAVDDCKIAKPPTVLSSVGEASLPGSKLLQMWEIDFEPVLLSNKIPDDRSLDKFRNDVLSTIDGIQQDALLKKSLMVGLLSPSDKANTLQLLERQKDLIRPMGCLEAFLFSLQTNRLDMVSSPSEFTAFVLRSTDRRKVRIYYYTSNEPGVRGMGSLLELVTKDVASGIWQAWLNIHNHNFFFDNKNPVRGTVAPSGTDIEFFRSLENDIQLSEAWITNGFDTLVLSGVEFGQFTD